jgi:hydroxymethylbilane synthase
MAHDQELRLGTRGSALALWQANAVAQRIADAGGPPCRIVIIKTSGDRLQEAPLSEIGGKRLFVKEIEDALLHGEIDLAVHSSKDMPAILPDGLTIAAVLPREDPLDAVVLPIRARGSGSRDQGSGIREQGSGIGDRGSGIRDQGSSARRAQPTALTTNDDPVALSTIDQLASVLGQAPKIGTSSVRRIAQLTRLFPGADFLPLRGNLDTRLRKLDHGDFDAIVLAAAGLRRLGFASRISFALPASACVPAPGQGIVAVEIRERDDGTRAAVAPIDDANANAALAAERGVVIALGGGCQTPIGALTSAVDAEAIEIVGVVVALDGSRAIRQQARGSRRDAAALGAAVGAALLAKGAGEILAAATDNSRQSPVVGHQS